MICPKCKKEIPAKSIFCIHCGRDPKTGKRSKKKRGKLFRCCSCGLIIGIVLLIILGVIGLTLMISPRLEDYNNIYRRPEETRRWLEIASKIEIETETTSVENGRLTLTTTIYNGSREAINFSNIFFEDLVETELVKSDPPHKYQSTGYGPRQVEFEREVSIEAGEKAKLTFEFQTQATEDYTGVLFILSTPVITNFAYFLVVINP